MVGLLAALRFDRRRNGEAIEPPIVTVERPLATEHRKFNLQQLHRHTLSGSPQMAAADKHKWETTWTNTEYENDDLAGDAVIDPFDRRMLGAGSGDAGSDTGSGSGIQGLGSGNWGSGSGDAGSGSGDDGSGSYSIELSPSFPPPLIPLPPSAPPPLKPPPPSAPLPPLKPPSPSEPPPAPPPLSALVPGLAMIYEADDEHVAVNAEGKVLRWNDLSGNDYHVTPSDASDAPTYNASGKFIHFRGMHCPRLRTANLPGVLPWNGRHVFVTITRDLDASGTVVGSYHPSFGRIIVGRESDNRNFGMCQGRAVYMDASARPTGDQPLELLEAAFARE